jgi:CCR4-NOT transcription complex subunit 9
MHQQQAGHHQHAQQQHAQQAAAAAAAAASAVQQQQQQQQQYNRLNGGHNNSGNNNNNNALAAAAAAAAAAGHGQDGPGGPDNVSEDNRRTMGYIADLLNEGTREAALLELSKKREQVPELALILWHSFGESDAERC